MSEQPTRMLTEQDVRAAAERLATRRRELAAAEAQWADAQAQFRAEHDDLIATVQTWKGARDEADSSARQIALRWYYEMGDQKPGYGLTVIMKHGLEYDDAEALAWAIAHQDLVPVTFDRKAFNEIAKTGKIPFVTRTTTPDVRIDGNLQAAINGTELQAALDAEQQGAPA